MRITEKQAMAMGLLPKKNKSSKYHAKRISVDGILFDSQAEANYYCFLKILLRKGDIDGFCRQARFIITEGKNGEKGTEYVTDFILFYPDGTYKIVDVKGVKTEIFKLKIKSFNEKYPNLKVHLEE